MAKAAVIGQQWQFFGFCLIYYNKFVNEAMKDPLIGFPP